MTDSEELADLMTMQSLEDIKNGRFAPIDDLCQMIKKKPDENELNDSSHKVDS